MALPPSEPRRIVSLVPAATELVFVLEAWDRVVGVSHECDFPPQVLSMPRVTSTRVEPHLPPRALDDAVRELAKKGEGPIKLEAAKLRELKPDLIVAQTACPACALTPEEVRGVVADLRPRPEVAELKADSYEGYLAEVRRFGTLLHRKEEAKREILKQWSLAKEIRAMTEGLPRPVVAVFDWIDPVMHSGYWTQELVEMAGGTYPFVAKGSAAARTNWEEVRQRAPEVIVAAPCGRTLEAAADELATAVRAHDLWDLPAVKNNRLYAVDGNRYFNRAGPRLVYSAAILARCLHGEKVPELPASIEAGYARLEIPRQAKG